MTLLGWFHLLAALVAMASGAVVLLGRKGTRGHRRLGWAYVASMVALNGSALLIYRLFGGFGPFHVAAIVSLGGLVMGVLVMRRPRDPRAVERHYYWMTWSYVGLLAAFVSEVGTRVPGAVFWWAVLAGTLLVVAVGSRLIRRGAASALRPFLDPPAAAG